MHFPNELEMTQRDLLLGTAATSLAAQAPEALAQSASTAAMPPTAALPMSFTVNGKVHELTLDPRHA